MRPILKKFREEFELKLGMGLATALICIIILTMTFPAFPNIKAAIIAGAVFIIFYALHKLLNQFQL